MAGRPTELVRERKRFQATMLELRQVTDDLMTLALPGGLWDGALWKLYVAIELLAVRTYSEWEDFAQKIFVLALAQDTSALASHTGLSIKPQKVTADMANALLTARGYIEFRDVEDLRGKAKQWLQLNPFANLTVDDRKVLRELRALRNYIVHRSRQSAGSYVEMLKANNITAKLAPGDFLRAAVGAEPSRLHHYLTGLEGAAGRMV